MEESQFASTNLLPSDTILRRLTCDLPCLEVDLDDFVADLLLQGHEDAIRLLVEREARLVQECLNVLKLRIILVFVLDLLLKRPVELLSAIDDAIGEATGGSGHSEHAGSGALSHSLARGLHAD